MSNTVSKLIFQCCGDHTLTLIRRCNWSAQLSAVNTLHFIKMHHIIIFTCC